ncbi:hypothetical protein FOA52_014292 [Chlamydomonas sp. UWO 241]|nr:hypothetical protein FOA52_014292 [Chlamydomonas sp. UWO 241]
MLRAAPGRVSVLLLPVAHRAWLLHALPSPPHAVVQLAAAADSSGRTLLEQASRAWAGARARVAASLDTKWRQVQAAPPASFTGQLHRLAKFVLSREDAVESFLKSVPADTLSVQVFYPTGLRVALVRRALRQLAARRLSQHERWSTGWAASIVPQIPLLVTPISNVTIYYSAYRYWSHSQAASGARVLKRAFNRLDALQRAAATANSGRKPPQRTLLGMLPKSFRTLGGEVGSSSSIGGCLLGGHLVAPQTQQVQLSFEPCAALARGSDGGGGGDHTLSLSGVRGLGEDDVRSVGRAFELGETELEALLEAAARVRRQCAGRR